MHICIFAFGALCTLLCVPAFAIAAALPCPYTWNSTLRLGSSGDDVLHLQQFLNADPTTQIARTGAGSPGNESTFFGTLTAQAIAKFQEEYASDILAPNGLTSGTGVVGASTRAKLNALCAANTTVVTTTAAAASNVPETNALTVSAPDQPAATLAPAGAGGVPFTTFTLTAGNEDVTVNSITVERVGPGEDGALADVTLADQNGNAIGGTEYLNAKHETTFSGPYVVPASTTATLTLSGDMASDESDFAGEMPAIQIDSIDASAPVSGSLPIRGTAQIINDTLQIGGATAVLSSFDPGNATTHYIGDKAVRFSGIRITANSEEDLTLSSISWDQTGTAGPEDIANVATVVDGTVYPANADGSSYTSTFSPGIVIKKGEGVDVYLKGDLTTTGANRTVEFDVDDSSDIALTGNTYGYGVGISPAGNTAETGNSVFLTSDGTTDGDEGASFFAGSAVTISPGALISISR